jgi:hypothetical protein
MPDRFTNDWTNLVREHLHPLRLPASQQQEVIAELAAHLEDLYDQQIQHGLSESEARERVINEVIQWRPLAQDIQRSKFKEGTMNQGRMNARTKQLWLPGLVSLLAAMLSLTAVLLLGVQPHIYYAHQAATTFNFQWLAALPLCGAVAAWLSRRAGGGLLTCLASSLFPVMAFLACFCIIFLGATILGSERALGPSAFVLFMWNWVFLPGTPLLLGALPFLFRRNQSPQVTS